MTPDEADECHDGGWNDEEILLFLKYKAKLEAMQVVDAEYLAELTVLKARQAKTRRKRGDDP